MNIHQLEVLFNSQDDLAGAAEGLGFEGHEFFETSSMRKIGEVQVYPQFCVNFKSRCKIQSR